MSVAAINRINKLIEESLFRYRVIKISAEITLGKTGNMQISNGCN